MWGSISTLSDPALAPAGNHTLTITALAKHDIGRPWREAIGPYADRALAAWEQTFPGLTESISFMESATPPTLERYTRNTDGAIYGWENVPRQTGGLRTPHACPIEGLFLCGHWTPPGSGAIRTLVLRLPHRPDRPRRWRRRSDRVRSPHAAARARLVSPQPATQEGGHGGRRSAVKEAVVEALALDDDEVTPEATLMDDLGAESIDLLDILFRIEKSTGVKIEASDLGDYIQGGIPDDEFSDENQIISATGAQQLHKVMPQTDPSELEGKLKADEVMTLFTVENLVEMVKTRANGAAG